VEPFSYEWSEMSHPSDSKARASNRKQQAKSSTAPPEESKPGAENPNDGAKSAVKESKPEANNTNYRWYRRYAERIRVNPTEAEQIRVNRS
jgi:hypothetical protein